MFFAETSPWAALGPRLITALTDRFAAEGLAPDRLGLVMITRGAAGPEGFAHRGDWPCYPCSLVKLSLIHISEPTRRTPISYAVFCLKKKIFLMIRRPPRSTLD